jgi:hypothetical protein
MPSTFAIWRLVFSTRGEPDMVEGRAAPGVVLRARDPWRNGAASSRAAIGFRPVDVSGDGIVPDELKAWPGSSHGPFSSAMRPRLKSEIPGQSRHALPVVLGRVVP